MRPMLPASEQTLAASATCPRDWKTQVPGDTQTEQAALAKENKGSTEAMIQQRGSTLARVSKKSLVDSVRATSPVRT